jgi:ABC-type Zn uptake system ZnuABC Zn-binding protein ZnuA
MHNNIALLRNMCSVLFNGASKQGNNEGSKEARKQGGGLKVVARFSLPNSPARNIGGKTANRANIAQTIDF